MTIQNRQYVCEVVLPENSPLHSVIGRPATRKSIAKRSAAFEACLLLRKNKYLDSYLLPIYQKQLPAMRNAHLALTLKNTQAYDMRVKPSIWTDSVGTVPQELYMMVIVLEGSELSRPCQPLAVLTKSPLPQIPEIPLYLRPNCRSQALCTPLANRLHVDLDALNAINAFTLRIFKDVFNKTYEANVTTMPYWLVPIIPGCNLSAQAKGEEIVDWQAIRLVHENEFLPWDEHTPNDFFADKFLVDPFDGGLRYFTIGVDPALKPLDPVPSGAPTRRRMENILQYTISLYRNSKARLNYKHEQPVILAHRVLHRRNWLDEFAKDEEVASKCYVCPEPLYVSAVSVGCRCTGQVAHASVVANHRCRHVLHHPRRHVQNRLRPHRARTVPES